MKPKAWIAKVCAASGLLVATYGVLALLKTAQVANGIWTQITRHFRYLLIGLIVLMSLWVTVPISLARANWQPATTLYGAVVRNGLFNTTCSVSITNWGSTATNITVQTSLGSSTKSVLARGTEIWFASELGLNASQETSVSASNPNNYPMTGVVRCRNTAAPAGQDSIVAEEMTGSGSTFTIPLLPAGAAAGGYSASVVGAPATSVYYADGNFMNDASTYAWSRAYDANAYARAVAESGMRAARGQVVTSNGARASMTGATVSGRTVVFPRVFKDSQRGTIISVVNVGGTAATVNFTAYEESPGTGTSTYGPITLSAGQAHFIELPTNWNPPFSAMSVVAEATSSNAQLVGGILAYPAASWSNNPAFADLTLAPAGAHAFATEVRMTFRRQTPSGELSAIVIMNTSGHNGVPIRVIVRNPGGTIVLNQVYTLNAFRRLRIALTNDVTYPTDSYSLQVYPDSGIGTVAAVIVGQEVNSSAQFVGQWSTTAHYASTDTVPPTCVASPPPSWSWVSGSLNVTVTCSDNGSGIRGSSTFNHTLNPNADNQTVSGTVCDLAGNCTNYSFSPYRRDSSAPNAPSVTLGGFTGVPPWNPTTVSYAHNGDNGPSGVNRIECSINGGAFSSSNCVTSAPPNHGTTISARVVDNAGNVGPATTVTVQRDTQNPNAPSVTLGGFTGVPPWNPTTVSYAHNGDNGPSGVNRIECSINGGAFSSPNCVTSAPPNHGTTISARVVDNAGNVGPVTTVTVQRDTQNPNAPSVTLGGFTGVPPWNPTTVSYAHNGDNGPSGVNRIECSINGGAFSSPNCVTSAPPNHGTTISARVVDNAGNVGPVTTVTVQRDTQNPNAPSVILGGFSGGTWNPTTISYAHNGDNGPSGVAWPASLQCSVDGGAWSSTCPDNTTLPTLPHGTTIAARVKDNAGNQGPGSAPVTIQRDTTPPATAIGAITPEYRNTAPQLFYAPTSDGGSPFTTVRLLRRPSGADPWTDSGALTNGMGWTPPAQGRWYVASKVTDQAGNVESDPTGATDDATFFYDTIAPSAPTVSAVGPSNSRTPNVAWSAGSDPGAPTTGSGVWTYRVLILRSDNSVATQFDVAAPATNANVNVSLDDGSYIARVAAIDRAGNQSAYSAGYAFSVDSTTTFGGVVYSDTTPLGQFNGESGVAGVAVTLTQPTSAVSTTTSSALGDYSFSGFTAPGFYTISIGTPAGYVRTTPDEVRRLVVVGSDFPDIHFGLRYIGNQNTQFLWVNAQCTDGSPFPGAPFTVEGPALNTTAATGAEGGWAAEVSQPGVYTVTLIDVGIPLVAPWDVNPVAVTVPVDGSGGATFVLGCSDIDEGTGGIVVRLFDADNPAATPAVYAGRPVTASNGISVLVGTSNAAGYVAFTGLVSGTWVVTGPVIGGQWLVQPGFEAYVQGVNVVAPLASQVRYGYRLQDAAAVADKAAEDLTENGALYVGDVIRYTVSVTNNTGVTLTTVRLTDTLPVGLSFNGIESVTPAGCVAGLSGGQVLGLCAALGSGETMQVVFTATVTGTGTLVNSFVWSADQVGGRPGDECINAPCGGGDPRIGVDNAGTRKEVTPTVVRMGELVSYTIVLSNAGVVAATVEVTDTLAVSATLEGATPGYAQTGQTLVWSGVVVPADGTVVLTVTVRAGSGPLPGGYALANSVLIGTADGEITRNAPSVTVEPWRAFAPMVRRP